VNRQAKGDLFLETADSPQGAAAGTGTGQPAPAQQAVPKSRDMPGENLSAMNASPRSSFALAPGQLRAEMPASEYEDSFP
jgi:hypothetical protein